MEKFQKSADEAKSLVDKWIYFIKNSENLDVIPSNIDDDGLKTAYVDADRQTWTKEELNLYNDSKVQEADIVQRELLLLEIGEKKGMEKGEKRKEAEMILSMHKAGIPTPQIALITQKTEEEVGAIISANSL